MQDALARIASIFLAGAFLWAGASKLVTYSRWRGIVRRYALPSPVRSVSTLVVPLLELGVAFLIVLVSPRGGAAVALANLCLFSLAVLRARSLNGDKLPCGCFGGAEERHYATMLWRNFALALLVAVVLRGPEAPITAGASLPGRGDMIPAALTLVGAAVVVWMLSQFHGSSRRREQP
ncbi:MAG TPA: MauE/DoxX family redox-associated membrane protein [Actinomycetota bacterium]|nr:MauE/DoxX family redox-associated membrane protein [Actinomycetota bacterium]